MKSTQVKSHKRKGRVVKSHSRAVKGAMKNSCSGMSAEECKSKYDAMVVKYGENSPQAKKLAMKMEGMEEIVEKDSRYPKGKVRASISKMNKIKGLENATEHLSGKKMTKKEILENKAKATKLRKHSRGEYMRKNIEEELLTKEAKAKIVKNARNVRSDANAKTRLDLAKKSSGSTFASKKKLLNKNKNANFPEGIILGGKHFNKQGKPIVSKKW